MRRPLVSLLLAAAALLAIAFPALRMHTRLLSYTDLPRSLPVIKAYRDIQASFPGAQTPAEVVVKAPNVRAPNVVAAGEELVRRALATPYMKLPVTASVSRDGTVARINIPLVGNGTDASSDRALQLLRTKLIPATLGKAPGAETAVTGITAGTKDFNDQMKSRAPVIFAFVLGLAFCLLLLTFRSIVIPIKAILLNLISVFAAYGALVLIFQHHWAEGILGFHSNGAVVSWLPMFLFVVLFALSMDYHIFILTRVKELVDAGMSTDQAVERAVKRTAGTVTSAAVVMVAVFAVFASLRSLDIKQMGIGLAIAVILDATIVRAVLLPAGMKLLGDWNWYLPRSLEWLPTLSAESRHPVPAPDSAASTDELDLAGFDGPAVDQEPARTVEPAAHALDTVDRDAAST
jgi:RND superfamily putative drug exporter